MKKLFLFSMCLATMAMTVMGQNRPQTPPDEFTHQVLTLADNLSNNLNNQ